MTEQPGPRPRMNLEKIETWVDQSIQQAEREGAFKDLPGAGKPLTGLDRPHDPDWWLKGLIERERLDLSEALPGAMALRRERDRMPESLAALADEAVVRERLEDFNERVLADRRRPWDGPGSPPIVGRVDVDQMVERWRAVRAQLAHEATAEAATGVAEGSTSQTVGAAGDLSMGEASRPWWRRRRSAST